jgi:hypothetical protein
MRPRRLFEQPVRWRRNELRKGSERKREKRKTLEAEREKSVFGAKKLSSFSADKLGFLSFSFFLLLPSPAVGYLPLPAYLVVGVASPSRGAEKPE